MNTVDSTSDDRTANNTMRHRYRVLSDDEKALMLEIKDKGAEFVDLLHRIGRTGPHTPGLADRGTYETERFGSRNLALAFEHVEDAVYRAVKHITA